MKYNMRNILLVSVVYIMLCSTVYAEIQQGLNINPKGNIATKENTNCDSFETCYQLFNKEESPVILRLFYTKRAKVNKFNILNDIVVKINDIGCPLKFDVYKKNLSSNELLDTFNYTGFGDECVTYITNLTGEGINSNNAVKQLEIKYCPKDTDPLQFCDKGIVFAKVIDFLNEKEESSQFRYNEFDKNENTLNSIQRYRENFNGNNYRNNNVPDELIGDTKYKIGKQRLENEQSGSVSDIEDNQRNNIGGYRPLN